MIRPAAPGDAPLILAFIRELAKYEKLAHEAVAEVGGIERWVFGPDPAAFVLIAEDVEGDPAGFALAFRTFSTFLGRPGLYLEDLFVRPSHRGAGHGKALLLALAEEGRARGYGRLEWSVLDWNTPSIEFYRSVGAKPREGWTVMRLEL